jgi:hypothetical protein
MDSWRDDASIEVMTLLDLKNVRTIAISSGACGDTVLTYESSY